MWGVAEVEPLGPELQSPAFAEPEITEQTAVEAYNSRTAQRVASRCAESRFRDGSERERIVERHVATDAAELHNLRLYLVGSLAVPGRVERRSRRRDGKREPAIRAEDAI